MFYLAAFRRRFYAASDPPSIRRALAMLPLVAAVVMAYGYVGLSHLEDQFSRTETSGLLDETFRAGILVVDPGLEPETPRAATFLYSLQTAGWLARLYLLFFTLRPVILRKRQEAPSEKVEEIFAKHGRHSLSAFAVQDDKHHRLLAGGQALVAYATRGSVALTCGDPLAGDGEFELAVRQFLEFCRRHGWTPCFFPVTEWLLLEASTDTVLEQTDHYGFGATGVGDMRTGFQITALSDTKRHPSIAFAYIVKLPTASEAKGLGTGRADHQILGLASKKMGGTDVDFNLGMLLNGQEVCCGHAAGVQASLGFSRDTSYGFGLQGELSGQSLDADQPRGIFALGALNFQFGRRFILDLGLRCGLNPSAPRFGVFFGITLGVANLFKL